MTTVVRRRPIHRSPLWGDYFKSPANVSAFKDPRQVGTILRQHDLSSPAVKTLFPILRTNMLEHLATAPEVAQAYLAGVVEGTQRSFFGFAQTMGLLATSVLNGARRAGPEVHDWFLSFFINLPLGWKGKTYPAMAVFERKAVPEYSERFSAVREALAMGQMGYIPKMIATNHPKTDEALTIHFRMMFDWFTDVVETAVFGMTTILPALIKADHPRTAQALELVKYFSKDQDAKIMGKACKVLTRAAVLFYDKDRSEFDRIVEILVRRATRSDSFERRAKALQNLATIYRFLYSRGEGLPLRLRIIDLFTKNANKIGSEPAVEDNRSRSKEERPFSRALFSFAAILCTTGELGAALTITRVAFAILNGAGLNLVKHGSGYLRRLIEVAASSGSSTPELVKYIVAEIIEDNRHFVTHDIPAYLINIALALKESYPKEAKEIMERAICLVRAAAVTSDAHYYAKVAFHYELELTPEKVNEILIACEEVGIDPLKTYMLAEVIGETDIDNRRVGLLRDEVTKLRAIDLPIAEYFEWMIHGRPSPQDLDDVRLFLSAVRGEAVAGKKFIGRGSQGQSRRNLSDSTYLAEVRAKSPALVPILLRMETILSEVYEYNPNMVKHKLLELTKKLGEPKFAKMRRAFVAAIGTDRVQAAKLIGHLMSLAASSQELSHYDRFKLVSQLHYLGYAIFNTSYAEIFDGFKVEKVKDALEIFGSLLLAVKAIGLHSPELAQAFERLGQIRDDISAGTLSRVDYYSLMAVSQLIDRGINQTIVGFHREISGPVNEVAGVLKERDQESSKRFQFYTDRYIRASLLHQLSEASASLSAYLRALNLYPLATTIAHELRVDEYTELQTGYGAYAERTEAKLVGQIIRLARGIAPVRESGLEVWVEQTTKGILELYIHDELFAPRGRAWLDGRELSVSEARSLLDVTLSNATLMAMWRHSD